MQQLYRQLSELMGGMLPPFVAPANNIHVLDIGWGMGESVYETALQYPSTHITGIDRDVSTVKQAQSLVRGLNNVTVFVHDMRHFEDIGSVGVTGANERSGIQWSDLAV